MHFITGILSQCWVPQCCQELVNNLHQSMAHLTLDTVLCVRVKPLPTGICCFFIDVIVHPMSIGSPCGGLHQYSLPTTHFFCCKWEVYVILLWWKNRVHKVNLLPLISPPLCFYSSIREGYWSPSQLRSFRVMLELFVVGVQLASMSPVYFPASPAQC